MNTCRLMQTTPTQLIILILNHLIVIIIAINMEQMGSEIIHPIERGRGGGDKGTICVHEDKIAVFNKIAFFNLQGDV